MTNKVNMRSAYIESLNDFDARMQSERRSWWEHLA